MRLRSFAALGVFVVASLLLTDAHAGPLGAFLHRITGQNNRVEARAMLRKNYARFDRAKDVLLSGEIGDAHGKRALAQGQLLLEQRDHLAKAARHFSILPGYHLKKAKALELRISNQ